MQGLKNSVQGFLGQEKYMGNGNVEMYQRIVTGIHNVCTEILECEKKGYEKKSIEKILKPARDVHGKSFFIKRLQEWPRGYPGDFETVEYLCDAKNKSPKNTMEFYCENYAL